MDSRHREQSGAQLRRARERLGLTLREVAARIHYDASSIGAAERGTRTPSAEHVLLLVRELEARGQTHYALSQALLDERRRADKVCYLYCQRRTPPDGRAA